MAESEPEVGHVSHRPDMSHAFWWGLFAIGGMAVAILLPVHILLQGVLAPLGIVSVVGKTSDPNRSYETLRAAVAHPLVKLYLFVLISLPLYHTAHRMRYFILDLGVHWGRQFFAWLLYGGAVLGTLITAYVLLTVP